MIAFTEIAEKKARSKTSALDTQSIATAYNVSLAQRRSRAQKGEVNNESSDEDKTRIGLANK